MLIVLLYVLTLCTFQREMERLGGHAGYAEINHTDAVIAAKAAAARREYKEQLRANQRKLEESLKSRPSLLERHDKVSELLTDF